MNGTAKPLALVLQDYTTATPTPPKHFRLPQSNQIITSVDRHYYLGNQIGEGFFGVVYECWDEWGNSCVAKVLRPKNQTYEQVRSEWLNELVKLIQLRHPRVTHVYDAFEFQDAFYLIIERCFSKLEELIRLPSLNPDLWIPHVARNVLEAVDFMHSANYVHKDIHHGNVFIVETKNAFGNNDSAFSFKVGDLGITRLETDIRVFGTMLAEWMKPPEAINSGEFGKIDRKVDIYHCGLLLLSILLKQIPTFTDQEIIEGAPRLTAEAMTSPYSAPIARALRRHVEHRTPSALQFWREISQARPRPVLASSVSSHEKENIQD